MTNTTSTTAGHDVVETAVRMTAAYGAVDAARKADEFKRWASRGSADRLFWRMVSESIRDANQEA